MESGKVMLGVLGGLAVGVLLGVLFAPAKGSKTRKRILNKGKGYANGLKDKFEKIYKEGADKYNGLLSEAKDEISKSEI